MTENKLHKILSWEIPEHEKHERGWLWYLIAGVVVVALVTYAIVSANYLFAILVVMFIAISVMHGFKDPMMIEFVITDDGVIVGSKLYDFEKFKNFSVIYRPKEGTKQLYFEFEDRIRPSLSIPLLDINPMLVRDVLTEYLEEDLEREHEYFTEYIASIFKI